MIGQLHKISYTLNHGFAEDLQLVFFVTPMVFLVLLALGHLIWKKPDAPKWPPILFLICILSFTASGVFSIKKDTMRRDKAQKSLQNNDYAGAFSYGMEPPDIVGGAMDKDALGETRELERALAAIPKDRMCAHSFAWQVVNAFDKGRKDQAALILQSVMRQCPASRTATDTLAYFATDVTLDVLRWLLDQGIHPEQDILMGYSYSHPSRGEGTFPHQREFAGANTGAWNKRRPLTHLVVSRGDVRALEMLLASGASLATLDDYGRSVLHIAAFVGNTEAARLALDAGITPNARDGGPEPDDILSWGYSNTPLHMASLGARPEVMALLLASDASVDAVTTLGSTPLMLAALGKGNGEKIVASLLEMGASASLANTRGETPLHLLCDPRQKSVPDFIVYPYQHLIFRPDFQNSKNKLPGQSDLLRQKDVLDCIRLLLAAGANPTALDTNGNSLLHYAVKSSHSWWNDLRAIAALLLDAGADAYARDHGGITPYDIVKAAPLVDEFKKRKAR